MGAALGIIIISAFFSFLVILLGKAFGKRWNGWNVGVVFACLGVLGQVAQVNILGIVGGLLGTLVVMNQARSFEAEE